MEKKDTNPDIQQEIKFLEPFITPNKRAKINEVLKYRTRYITVGLEDIFHPQNASAVLRTCDCFGIQDAHIIENRNTYKISPDVSHGSEKWVDIIKHNQYRENTALCINQLKQAGYKIVATTPEDHDCYLEELSLEQPVAIFLGAEALGLSSTTREMADVRMKIPMYGFTQSFNISVSAAIILYNLTQKMQGLDIPWQLSPEARDEVKLRWFRKIRKLKNKNQ